MRKFVAVVMLIAFTVAIPTFVLCCVGYCRYGVGSFDPMKWSESSKELFVMWAALACMFWGWIAAPVHTHK